MVIRKKSEFFGCFSIQLKNQHFVSMWVSGCVCGVGGIIMEFQKMISHLVWQNKVIGSAVWSNCSQLHLFLPRIAMNTWMLWIQSVVSRHTKNDSAHRGFIISGRENKRASLVVAPRTSLERLPPMVTALPRASWDRSERLHSYPDVITLYYKL